MTGTRPREHAPPAEHANWPSLPEELRQVISSGLEPDPQRRADLPTFLTQLREVRWQALTEHVLNSNSDMLVPVKLQAAIAVARADEPTTFRPLVKEGRPEPATTGDLVKVEALASVDGYLTVLVLDSSGNVQVGLPKPNEPENLYRAGQRCGLVFRLTPPAGTERLLIHWSAQDVRRTPLEWLHWMELIGLVSEDADAGRRTPVRGMEILVAKKGPAPERDRRILVIPVPHVSARPA